MRPLVHLVRLCGDTVLLGFRSGRFWVALVIPVLLLAAATATAAKAVVPAALYALF